MRKRLRRAGGGRGWRGGGVGGGEGRHRETPNILVAVFACKLYTGTQLLYK